MKLYHGSKIIIKKPQFGLGKATNDYGRGFYCTEHLELAKEWACPRKEDGFANEYEINLKGMKVLDLNGPGMGVMTQYLYPKSREFKCVEIDRESVAYLTETFPKLRGGIIGDDFLKMDLKEVFGGQQFVLTGNYPYDISSQIFFKMLDNKELIPCCTGMIQREVALRIAAEPGNKQYGILSVLIQAWYSTEKNGQR